MVALLLAAGFETTTLLLANAVVALLAHPDQADRLRDEPMLAEPGVEELLRFDSPVQVPHTRSASTDFEIGGVFLAADQPIVTLRSAANRDPAVFTDPDLLRLDRAEGVPLSFRRRHPPLPRRAPGPAGSADRLAGGAAPLPEAGDDRNSAAPRRAHPARVLGGPDIGALTRVLIARPLPRTDPPCSPRVPCRAPGHRGPSVDRAPRNLQESI